MSRCLVPAVCHPFSCFSPTYARGRLWGLLPAQGSWASICTSVTWQKGDDGLYVTDTQICNKMPNSVRSYIQVSHHPCFSESKIIAILGNHPVASCFYQHSSACLSSFTSLFTTGGTFWQCRQHLRGLLALALHPVICPEAWPWESEAMRGPSLTPGWLAPSSLQQFRVVAEPSEKALSSSEIKQAGSSGGGESCHPLTQAHSGIHTHLN